MKAITPLLNWEHSPEMRTITYSEQNSFLNTEKNSASIEPSAQKSVEEDEYLLNIDQNATGFVSK